MQFLAAHYWQSADENTSSILLQQVYYQKKKLPILLACACREESEQKRKEVVTGLADWFYREGMYLCGKAGGKRLSLIEDKLVQHFEKQRGLIEESSMAGALCVGERLLLFQQGDHPLWLVNLHNHRPGSSALRIAPKGEKGIWIQQGWIEPGAGLLLASESFCANLPEREWQECLDVKGLGKQSKMIRRLEELGNAAKAKGGSDLSAIYVVAK